MGSDDDPEARSRITAFLQALQELGWSEGGPVQIDLRWGGRSPEGIAAQARSRTSFSLVPRMRWSRCKKRRSDSDMAGAQPRTIQVYTKDLPLLPQHLSLR
jgi:hypothetical protein